MAVPKLLQEWVGRIVERYPGPVSILCMLIGAGFVIASFTGAARYAEFDGGGRVVGRVVSATESPDREPRFAADATWTTEGKLPWETVKHQAVVEILSRQLPHEKAVDPERRLHAGSELPLVLSTINPDVAISAAALDDAHILKVPPGKNALAIPLVLGLVVFLGGLVSLIQVAMKSRTPPIRRTQRSTKVQARPLRR